MGRGCELDGDARAQPPGRVPPEGCATKFSIALRFLHKLTRPDEVVENTVEFAAESSTLQTQTNLQFIV